MRDMSIEAAMIGLGVPIVALGLALAASSLSPAQLLIPWISAAVVSIAALVSAVVITRRVSAHKHHEEDQRNGGRGVKYLHCSKPNTESQSGSTEPASQSIMLWATVAGGKPKNEDYIDGRRLEGCNVLAIADGVSFSTRGDLAAKAAVEGFLSKIEAIWQQRRVIGREELREAYIAAHNEIKKCAEEVRQRENLQSLNPQTTFIGIIELADRFIFTYLGDGGITLFRSAVDAGAILHSPVSKLLLVPHTVGTFLTRYLSVEGELPKHGYMEVDKALEGGEIVVAGTDGALPMGSVITTSQGFLTDLKRVFQENVSKFNKETVESVLVQGLKQLTTDDNRTLGVILTHDALNSWWRELQRARQQQREPASGQE